MHGPVEVVERARLHVATLVPPECAHEILDLPGDRVLVDRGEQGKPFEREARKDRFEIVSQPSGGVRVDAIEVAEYRLDGRGCGTRHLTRQVHPIDAHARRIGATGVPCAQPPNELDILLQGAEPIAERALERGIARGTRSEDVVVEQFRLGKARLQRDGGNTFRRHEVFHDAIAHQEWLVATMERFAECDETAVAEDRSERPEVANR